MLGSSGWVSHLDLAAQDDVAEGGVHHKHDHEDHEEVRQVVRRNRQGVRDDAEARVEVHRLQKDEQHQYQVVAAQVEFEINISKLLIRL